MVLAWLEIKAAYSGEKRKRLSVRVKSGLLTTKNREVFRG